MTKRLSESILAVGLVSALALSAATSSFAQTQQRQRAPAQQNQGLGAAPQDETLGQAAPRGQSRAPAGAQQSGQCWIPTNEDQGMGYPGDCSAKGARQNK